MGRKRGPDRREHADGYIIVRVADEEITQHSVRKDGWMYEHRYVAECVLGRRLRPDEQVDHRNEDKHDNRWSNLRVMTRADHASRHYQDRYR